MTPKYRLIFFDVDSTLVTIEGIDVLAEGNPEIVRLTEAAMNGEIPLDEVYARRLEMIRPNRAAIDKLAKRYLESIVDGAPETIAALKKAGCIIHLVTAAHNSGLAAAVVPTGTASSAALKAAKPEHYLDRLADLVQIVRNGASA